MLLGFHGKLLLTLTKETGKETTEGARSDSLLTACKGTAN